jgi:arylsulfatase A-like enzyme
MGTDTFVDIAVVENASSRRKEVYLRPGLALLSIITIVSLSLEIEILDHVDSFSRFMTYREIALDAGFVLVGVLGVWLFWWFAVFALVKSFTPFAWAKRLHVSLSWDLWLSLPASYLALDVFNAIKIQFFPQWNPGRPVWVLLGLVLGSIVFGCLSGVDTSDLQAFCRHRLAPVGWIHVGLGVIAALILWASGAHVFHDYARPGNLLATSNLPDIYLITIDALRADDMSVYGYELPTTPNLERFAQRSSTFEYFVANSNFTTPTTTSIETGELPWEHRIFQLWGFLRQRETPNLGSVLHQQGYYTAMISPNVLASPIQHGTLNSYDAIEYPAALSTYRLWRYAKFVGTNSQSTLSVSVVGHLAKLLAYVDMLIWGDRYPYPAEGVFDDARSFVEHRQISQPLFLWTHILPPHDPYWPPASYRQRFSTTEKVNSYANPIDTDSHKLNGGVSAAEHRARYDEMVLYADHAVGDFLDWLDQTGRLDRSIVIVSADHGESFEHNWFGHTGPYLYNGLIHVPLLIHLPGQHHGGRVSYVAQQADLLPTILDLVGAPTSTTAEGASLKPLLEGKPLPERYIYSMNLEPNRVFDPITKGTVAVLDSDFKYVNYLDRHQEALYRYKSDRLEDHNLLDSEPEVAARMRGVLSEKLKDVNRQFTPKR